jgi:hypothetical protein
MLFAPGFGIFAPKSFSTWNCKLPWCFNKYKWLAFEKRSKSEDGRTAFSFFFIHILIFFNMKVHILEK